MRTAADIVQAARACVGARFRIHGREPAWGLDCVGVAACAFSLEVPASYPVRGGTAQQIAVLIEQAGLRRHFGEPAPGDLLLVRAGPNQLHLMVRTDDGFVHADAGLRRVVEAPSITVGSVVGMWQRGEG